MRSVPLTILMAELVALVSSLLQYANGTGILHLHMKKRNINYRHVFYKRYSPFPAFASATFSSGDAVLHGRVVICSCNPFLATDSANR